MLSRAALAPSIFLALLSAVAAHAATIEVFATDSAGQPVADVAVFAVSPSTTAETKNAKASIEQKDREFIPFVSVIQQGTTVSFPNQDPILHHVYSFSPAKNFEIKLYTGKAPSEVIFDKSGVVVLGCNIHDWMTAYVVVVPTPYFARTDATGMARLRDVPAGSYEIRAWHPMQRAALVPYPLAVDARASAKATFTFDLVSRKPRYKPPLDRLRY
ncbi:MAG: methylamine utilization protein [Usitatibacter sp.]